MKHAKIQQCIPLQNICLQDGGKPFIPNFWAKPLKRLSKLSWFYNSAETIRTNINMLSFSENRCYYDLMKLGPKPVRRCYRCLLNLGGHCWEFACPRRQWNKKKCPGFENDELYAQFRKWQEAPRVKTRRELRQEIFRSAKQARRLRYSRKLSAKKCRNN